MNRIPGRAALAATFVALLLWAAPAWADRHHRPRSVPEFDPSTVGAIVAILVGGGALLARRRR